MRIVIKRLEWSNIFSYGTAINHIDFTANSVVQLLGLNGHGKSSIALILEEVLFNKNSKGVKKADMLNRYTEESTLFIALEFSIGNDEYLIKSERGKTQKVSLIKNGEDISGHTATTTYKLLQDIIGIDHKTFTQIVYQSSASNLEFLKSPDTARKKFLIELLNLSKYIRIGEHFKKLAASTNLQLASVEGKLQTVQKWLDKIKDKDLTIKELQKIPTIDDTIISTIESLKVELNNIQQTNKLISNNNLYKDMLDNLGDPVLAVPPAELNTDKYQEDKGRYNSAITSARSFIDKMNKLGDQCPTCNQKVEPEFSAHVIAEQTKVLEENTEKLNNCTKIIEKIQKDIKLYNEELRRQQELERYLSLYDSSIPTKHVEASGINIKITELEAELSRQKIAYREATINNSKIEASNVENETILSRREDMLAELNELSKELDIIKTQQSYETLLSKVYSTNGLVAYKIESLVTDLENISNQYLVELSEGRFSINFEVSGDKLNVVITDNGHNIDIYGLSAGELARVNIAVLLAIRKLTNSIFANLQINLLFLDETISTLDIEGREKLIEILLQEEGLNTVLVSHGYTHPLLSKVTVIKEANISRLAYD